MNNSVIAVGRGARVLLGRHSIRPLRLAGLRWASTSVPHLNNNNSNYYQKYNGGFGRAKGPEGENTDSSIWDTAVYFATFIGSTVITTYVCFKGFLEPKLAEMNETQARECLRKALWLESNKSDYDYKSALRYYIRALESLPVTVNPLSDQYTRIELKIAEMYEKLSMFDQAKDIYNEMLFRFFGTLNDREMQQDKDKTNSLISKRSELIRKDLRILIKSLELNQDIERGKRNLLAHLLVAQEYILLRSPELKEFFEVKRERANKILQGKHMDLSEFKTFVNKENIKINDDGYMVLDLQKNSSGWEPFKEELFVARDLYTAYCLSSRDITSALSCKMTTVEWMVMADMPPGQILLAQANLGSLFYLQAEKLEADINRIDIKTIKEPSLLKDETIIKTLRTLNKNKRNCLTMSERCYDSIIDFFHSNKKLRYHMKDQLDSSISQALALSTYGKGVLSLHDQSYPQAERLLNDSIKLAKEADFIELLNEANNELNKVKKIRLNNEQKS